MSTKSKKRTSETYESDGGFVAPDDNSSAPKAKKAKTQAPTRAPVKSSNGTSNKDEEFWEVRGIIPPVFPYHAFARPFAYPHTKNITPTRRVNITSFKNQRMVNIREYYEDKSSGAMLPGKKGISLPIAQYSTLLTHLPSIEKALKEQGESVPRPEYGESGNVGAEAASAEEGGEESGKGKGNIRKAEKKKNFEATSEESEGGEDAEE
ncbi:MAG: hypothetical protein Q9183_006602 [Haloplaca sp. 2 TL-2023]